MRALLISNSGRPFLEHCLPTIVEFLNGEKQLLFCSAAAFTDSQAYFEKTRDALAPSGIALTHLELQKEPRKQLHQAKALLVGGGNTYRLLQSLHAADMVQAIRDRALQDMPFIGWSAGANLAGPTILTTNDWNVVGLNRFDALKLVPFNINPHYIESDPRMAPFSETRDDRIAEYHKVNHNPVCGIEEQTMIWCEKSRYTVRGQGRVRYFKPGQKPVDYTNGKSLP